MPKRSLWGYSPPCVKEFTEQLQMEHQTRRSGLEQRVQELKLELDAIREQIKNFQTPKTNTILNQISGKLLEAHLEQSRRILEKQEINERFLEEEEDWKQTEAENKKRLREELMTLMEQLNSASAKPGAGD